MSSPRRSSDVGGLAASAPHVVFALFVALPAFAVAWWREGGQVAVVLYRQPKEAAIAVLGWLFLLVFCWSFRAGGTTGESLVAGLAQGLRRWEIRLLVAFFGCMGLTLLWARVPTNGRVELRQYLPLFLILLVLLAWQRWDGRVARTLRLAWVVSLGLVSLVGLIQLAIPLPWLSPINPMIGAPNPSFMGYKNPMALALLGQLFLLAEMAFPPVGDGGEKGSGGWPGGPWPWRVVLVVELLHLATLGSRTSLFALALAAIYFGLLGAVAGRGRGERGRGWRGLVVMAAIGAIFVAALVLHPVGRAKASSVLGYLSQPARYLESDRGIYLRNTLVMVRHHPLGVGWGDWQTYYPVFRTHGREVAFTDTHQVRRAHSDPVQFLGEGGWPALLLWLGLLGGLIVGTARRGLGGERGALFLSAQVVAVALAMSTDYLLDLPYGKLQFFVLVALVVGRRAESPLTRDLSPQGARGPAEDRWLARALVAILALTFLVTTLFQLRLVRRSVAAAAIQQGYQQWVAHGAEALPFLARRVAEHGPTFLASPGQTKTTHRDYLVLAHAAELLGHRLEALAWARRALELHPYYPPAFELMALLVDEPDQAEAWRSAHRYLLHEARHGFDHPMPPLAEPPPVVE